MHRFMWKYRWKISMTKKKTDFFFRLSRWGYESDQSTWLRCLGAATILNHIPNRKKTFLHFNFLNRKYNISLTIGSFKSILGSIHVTWHFQNNLKTLSIQIFEKKFHFFLCMKYCRTMWRANILIVCPTKKRWWKALLCDSSPRSWQNVV